LVREKSEADKLREEFKAYTPPDLVRLHVSDLNCNYSLQTNTLLICLHVHRELTVLQLL